MKKIIVTLVLVITSMVSSAQQLVHLVNHYGANKAVTNIAEIGKNGQFSVGYQVYKVFTDFEPIRVNLWLTERTKTVGKLQKFIGVDIITTDGYVIKVRPQNPVNPKNYRAKTGRISGMGYAEISGARLPDRDFLQLSYSDIAKVYAVFLGGQRVNLTCKTSDAANVITYSLLKFIGG